MSKEYIEALDWLLANEMIYRGRTRLPISPALRDIKHRLEAIDNANPSEALECLEKLKGMEISSMPFSDEYGTQEVDLNDIRKVGSQLNTDFREYTTTIKQALLKAQEPKQYVDELKLVEKKLKALEIIKEKRVNVGTFIHLTKILKKDYEQCKALNNTFGANICDTEKEFLTEEEFDTLKEVLE